MGGSGKWINSLIGCRRQAKGDQETAGGGNGRSRKWKLWRSSPRPRRSPSVDSDTSSASEQVSDPFSVAVSTVARALPKDFKVVKQEWAATRIQTAFRAFLARRALKALKGIVRIQALVRGYQVRKQAAVTFKCMQALVRVQARVRARQVRMSTEGQAVQQMITDRRNQVDPLKDAEDGWCDNPGTLDQIKSKLQLRKEAVMKRERAIAYSISKQHWRSGSQGSKQSVLSLKSLELDKSNSEWSWLERWMAAKPWENRLMEQSQAKFSESCYTKRDRDICGKCSKHCVSDSIDVKKNGVASRKAVNCSAQSASSSEVRFDETSPLSSSICISTPLSGTTLVASEATEDSCSSWPNYMSLTQSIKLKQKDCRKQKSATSRQISEDQRHCGRMTISTGVPRSITCSDSSVPSKSSNR